MIKAEIKKKDTVYVLDLTYLETLQAAYNFALKVATNRDNYEDQRQIVDLGTSTEYEHIRVYVEEQQPQVEVEPPNTTAVEETEGSYIKPFYDKLTYLGQPIEVRGIKAQADNVGFVLLYEINGGPAQHTISGEGLRKLTYHAGQVLGYKDPTAIVPPADLLDEEAALEYVEDYLTDLLRAAAALRDDVDKTATAYVGFNKDE